MPVSFLPLTAKARVQSQVSPQEICGEQSGTGTGFSTNTSVSPVSTIPEMFYIHFHFNTSLTRSGIILKISRTMRRPLSNIYLDT